MPRAKRQRRWNPDAQQWEELCKVCKTYQRSNTRTHDANKEPDDGFKLRICPSCWKKLPPWKAPYATNKRDQGEHRRE